MHPSAFSSPAAISARTTPTPSALTAPGALRSRTGPGQRGPAGGALAGLPAGAPADASPGPYPGPLRRGLVPPGRYPSHPGAGHLGHPGRPRSPLPDLPELRAAVAAATRICPDFVPGQLLRRGVDSVVVAGTAGRLPVVVKALTRRTEASVRRFGREVAAHRAFVRQRPPVRTPRLVAADPERGLLVTERVPGRPLAVERQPRLCPPAAELRAAVTACSALNLWRPARETFPALLDYPARIRREHGLGLLTDRDAGDLAQLMHGLERMPRQFCHGEALPQNVVVGPSGVTFVDWHAAGWYLPGYDLAMLWTAVPDDLMSRRRISHQVQSYGTPSRDAFLVNLLLVLTGEVRRVETDSPDERQRVLLRRLHDDLKTARRAVRAAVGTR
ncbi:aminoglycoside phosphotransferase family protein [Allostreptomyces psammosilenae]|uniref:Aminoglycoside phosphotransferase domain-containing protein n=1 Tax=Allostreptomyces psammosilenae TaxID=1892865 RepID=A0A853AA29_9ACTN|nr:phosphotransferase [Allostreptomyces psammosilenae]NYI07481.1 hypothetical protein [Allostreptomyces psammosilenae]